MSGDTNLTPEPPLEARLRKALSAMDDITPPRDDLFVERALARGRARSNRHRRPVLAAAMAGILAVGGYGLTQLVPGPGSTPSSAPASAPAASTAAPGVAAAPESGADLALSPYRGPTTDTFTAPDPQLGAGPSGPGRNATQGPGGSIEPKTGGTSVMGLMNRLLVTHASTFAGGWSEDGALVLGFTSLPTSSQQAQMRGLVPDRGVTFELAPRTYEQQVQLADSIRTTVLPALRAQGVDVFLLSNDPATGVIVLHSPRPGTQTELDALAGAGRAVWG